MAAPGMNHLAPSSLTPEEETFLRAWLWEAGHLIKGPASRTAEEHGLVLVRVLEPASRLSSHLQGEALNRLSEGPCPPVNWPWPGLTGAAVLRLLWERLGQGRHVATRTQGNALGTGTDTDTV
jgi:hypothetical protein